jgi:hypothetical protein
MGDVGILGKREREVRRGRGRKEEERGKEGKHKVCQPLVETRVKTYTLPLPEFCFHNTAVVQFVCSPFVDSL